MLLTVDACNLIDAGRWSACSGGCFCYRIRCGLSHSAHDGEERVRFWSTEAPLGSAPETFYQLDVLY